MTSKPTEPLSERNSNVIDMTAYLKHKAVIQVSPKTKSPKVYNLRIEVKHDEDDTVHLEYCPSNKMIRETEEGNKVLFDHLTLILMDLCDSDPALEMALYDRLDARYTDEE